MRGVRDRTGRARGRADRLIARIGRRARRAGRWLDAAAWRQWLALLLLCLALFVPGTAALPVTDRDEARFAQASRQMVETGDLVDIRLQEKPRWKKPAGIYWMQAGAVAAVAQATGVPVERVGIWAYRLPSVLGATLATLGLFWALGPLLGRSAAFRAAAMTATALIVAAEANIAKTDAMLLGAVALVMGAYLRRRADPGSAGAGLGMWAALALGVVLKGPLVFLPLAGCVAWLCAAERRLDALRCIDWRRGPLLFVLLALPWYAAITIRTGGAFFEEAVLNDLLGKVAEGKEAHGAPPGTYLGVLWAIFWPWAPLLILAAPWLWRARGREEMRVLAGWAIPVWILFELVPTKLPHYVLPALPALAGMLALWLDGRRAPAAFAAGPKPDIVPGLGPEIRRPRQPGAVARVAAAVLFALVGGALALAALVLPPVLDGAFPLVGMIAALAGLAAVALATRALWRLRLAAFGALAVAASALLVAATLQFALPALATAFPSPRMAAASAPFAACAGRPAASITYREPSLVFLQGTDTALIDHETAARALREDAGALVWVEDRRRDRLDAAFAEAGGAPDLVELARVDAFNVNRGKPTTIRLLARAGDPTWADCPAVQERP